MEVGLLYLLKKKPRDRSPRAGVKKNKLLQLVCRHSQTVCYIHKRTLETLAVDVAEVVGLAVVASAELMIKPAAGFSKIVLCEISPIFVKYYRRRVVCGCSSR